MDWKLIKIDQETDHRFLNFYTFHYRVQDTDYPYFVASRHKKDDLFVSTKNRERPDGVLILAIKEEPVPSVLMVEQFRPPVNSYVWEFPAGLMEPSDSDLVETAKRESIEEAGVYLRDIRLLCPPSPTSVGLSDELLAVVEGKVDSLTQTHLERFEDIRARFVPLDEIRSMLEDKEHLIALNVRLCLLMLLERYGKSL